MRKVSRDEGIDKAMKEYNLDVIIGPGDSLLMNLAAAAAYPIAAMPLSTLEYNGRPFGVMAVASAHQEMALVKAMHAWHSTFSPRPVPDIDSVVSL
jgi:amidase